MIKEIINIPNGTQYISTAISELPANCIFDKGKVGCGGTTIALQSKNPYVIAVPYRALIKNKYEQNKDLIFKIDGYISKKKLKEYLKTTKSPKIMVTYDSLYKLNDLIDTSKYNILIDEYHLLFIKYAFRNDAVKCVLENYTRYKEFCFMTATLLETDFILTELKNIKLVEAVWDNVKTVSVNSIKCRTNVNDKIVKLIYEYLNDEKIGNAYFFVNSVDFIKLMVKICNLNDDNARAIWSESNTAETGLKRSTVLDLPRKINFLTETVFEGCDIYDENAIIYIISDGKRSTTLLDISTAFQQIAGRIRNTKYWDTIYHIYTNTRYSLKNNDYLEYVRFTEDMIDNCKKLALEYNSLSDTAIKQIQKLNNAYLSKVDNKYIVDYNLVNLDRYNFKITKELYKLRVNVTKEYESNGYSVTEGVHDTYLTGVYKTFKDTMIEIEANKNDFELINLANEKWPFLIDAIKKLGYVGIRKKNYNVTNIKNALIAKSDIELSNKIFYMLKNELAIDNGDFIESSKLKKTFAEIYKKLEIFKAPKGSDISNYYESRPQNKTINKKTYSGYIVTRPKLNIL